MQEKLLRGDEAMEAAMKQEQKLLKSQADLEERRREQVRLDQEIKAKKDEQLNYKHGFASRQEEIGAINEEIERVQQRESMAKDEMEDMQEVVHREREDLMDRIRELTREIRLKHLIIDQFIPAQEYMKIERRAEWADQIDNWTIPNIEFTGNNIKI